MPSHDPLTGCCCLSVLLSGDVTEGGAVRSPFSERMCRLVLLSEGALKNSEWVPRKTQDQKLKAKKKSDMTPNGACFAREHRSFILLCDFSDPYSALVTRLFRGLRGQVQRSQLPPQPFYKHISFAKYSAPCRSWRGEATKRHSKPIQVRSGQGLTAAHNKGNGREKRSGRAVVFCVVMVWAELMNGVGDYAGKDRASALDCKTFSWYFFV